MFSMSEAPIALAGAGLSGPRESISPKEAAKRRGFMSKLLVNGASDDEVRSVMKKEFGLDEHEADLLADQVAERMLQESAKKKPYKKAMAEKRLHGHIARAAARNAWGAVGVLEGQLARIQGTEEPIETNIKVDARLQQATLTVLGQMSPEQVQELVAEEVKRLPPR